MRMCRNGGRCILTCPLNGPIREHSALRHFCKIFYGIIKSGNVRCVKVSFPNESQEIQICLTPIQLLMYTFHFKMASYVSL